MKILAFAASLRKDSYNKKLLALAVEIARAAGAEVDHADFSEFDMPLYNADVQKEGFPPGAEEFKRRILEADGLMISSPEYNFSLPGTLKNAIDWASRFRPVPFAGKSGVLLSASTSLVGGIRGLWQLRIPLEGNSLMLYPDMYSLPQAQEAFDENGRLKDATRAERLQKIVEAYIGFGTALRK